MNSLIEVLIADQQTEAVAIINAAPVLGLNPVYAVVVESIDWAGGRVIVDDPEYPPDGRRIWSIELFELGFQLARRQVILVGPPFE